jgi:hypothetical protein
MSPDSLTREYIRARDIARTFGNAELEIPPDLVKAIGEYDRQLGIYLEQQKLLRFVRATVGGW